MGQSDCALSLSSESALVAAAGELARRWLAAGCMPLVVGLRGELGAGKTTFVRGLLRGLGYTGRVPSPTYTLLEAYELDALTVIHIDLYRLADAHEFEYLGVRDWMAEPGVWVFAEWPERAPELLERADLLIELEIVSEDARKLMFQARSEQAGNALRVVSDYDSSKDI